jgi:hypothetical protein
MYTALRDGSVIAFGGQPAAQSTTSESPVISITDVDRRPEGLGSWARVFESGGRVELIDVRRVLHGV